MTLTQIIRTILEFSAVVFLIWGYAHEDRFVAFERRLFAAVRRRRLHIVRGGRAVQSER